MKKPCIVSLLFWHWTGSRRKLRKGRVFRLYFVKFHDEFSTVSFVLQLIGEFFDQLSIDVSRRTRICPRVDVDLRYTLRPFL